MNISFTLTEMSESLERLGYTIKLEKEIQSVSVYHNAFEEVERNVYKVYFKGNEIKCDGYGTSRIEYVFNKELHKKLLKLMS